MTIAACAGLADRRPDFVSRIGVEAWRQAAERHAFAGIAMDTAAIMELDVDSATRIASCAVRFATAVEASEKVVMPLFPANARVMEPRTVRASVRRLLPQTQAA